MRSFTQSVDQVHPKAENMASVRNVDTLEHV